MRAISSRKFALAAELELVGRLFPVCLRSWKCTAGTSAWRITGSQTLKITDGLPGGQQPRDPKQARNDLRNGERQATDWCCSSP
jgi:hypothetical protein